MSFTEQQGRRSPASIAVVVVVHVAIGYAFVSGLAIKVLPRLPDITRAYNIPETPPPPPPRDIAPPKQTTPPQRPAFSDDRIVRVQVPDMTQVIVAPGKIDPIEIGDVGSGSVAQQQPDRPNLSRAPVALGSRGAWVTEADYPPGPLRLGIEGTTAISVMVGADGRVTACDVTESSGNAALDDATCRIYARRARFEPGLDEAGKPTMARRSDRVRWRIPKD